MASKDMIIWRRCMAIFSWNVMDSLRFIQDHLACRELFSVMSSNPSDVEVAATIDDARSIDIVQMTM